MKNKRRSATTRVAAALIVVSALLAGCGEQTPQQLVDSAKARMAKKDFRPAVIELKNALQKDGSLIEARFLLSRALLETGDPQGALVELKKVQQAGYDSNELVPPMVAALVFVGQADKFIAEYANVSLTVPKRHAELKAALAVAYAAKGKYDLARAAVEEALRADPQNIVAQLTIARLRYMAKDAAGALALVEKAIKEHPESAQAQVAKGDMLQSDAASLATAMAAYREALRLQPSNIDAHVGVINTLWRRKDFPGIEAQIGELKKVQGAGLHARYFETLLALERRDLKSAHEGSQQLLKMAPESPIFLRVAGMIEFERANYLQAIAHLSKALPNTPAPGPVRVLLARSQLRAGDPQKAITAVQPLLDAADGHVDPEVFSVAADAYLQQGNAEAARKMNERASKTDPQDIRSRTALALSDMDEGRLQQGLNSLRSIAAGNASVETDLILFMVHMRTGQFAEAEKVLAGIEKKNPNQAAVPYLTGRLELQRGRAAEARKAFEAALSRSPTYGLAVSALAGLDVAEGRPEGAVQRYRRLVEADPNSVEAAIELEAARARAGAKLDDVQGKLEGITKRFPDSELAWATLVRVLLDRRQFEAAAQIANEGVARFPNQPVFPDLLGRAELLQGHLNQAAQAFGKFASLQPNAVEPMMRSVDLNLARKDLPGAIAQLRKIVSAYPAHVPAQTALISLLQQTGKLDEALAQAKVLQKVLPNQPDGWTSGGIIQAAKRNPAAAAAEFKTSLAKQAASDVAARYHRVLLEASQPGEAAKFEADWLSKRPQDPVFNAYLGDQSLVREQYERAEAFYRVALKSLPSDPLLLNNLAWVLYKRGAPQAEQFANQSLEAAPKAPALMDTAAQIYASAGKIDKALDLQRRALEIEPDQGAHRLHYAQLLAKAGKKTEARAELEKLIQLGKAFPQQAEVQKLLGAL